MLYYCLQHHVDPAIGVYIIDRYTYYALDFLERVEPDSRKTLGEFVSIPDSACRYINVRASLCKILNLTQIFVLCFS